MKNKRTTIEDQFIPKGTFRPSQSLKTKIMEEAQKENPLFEKKPSRMKRIAWTCVSTAAALAMIVVARPFIKQAYSMENHFIKASEYFTKATSYTADIDSRTTPRENFAHIDAKENFVRHRLIAQPLTGCWRLEKPGRVAMYDGKTTRLWFPNEQYGFQWNRNAKGVMEDFAVLTDPFLMLSLETEYLRFNPKAVCKKFSEKGLLTIVIEAPANGNFENNYCRNTSLEETDTYREYVFEKKTGHLLRLKINAKINGKSITVFEMKNIEYNVKLDGSAFMAPEGVEWKTAEAEFDAENPAVKSLIGISPEKAVERIFEALRVWDTTVLNVAMAQYPLDKMKEFFEGFQLLSHGKAFRSGTYAGYFVPCKIKIQGQVDTTNVAIRNDNKQKVWMVDGGL